jgi:tetratricopeptide (TPR) repeat protein
MGRMSSEDDEVEAARAAHSGASAADIAVAAASRAKADAYLDQQTELARLQKENLLEQNAFELSHLRWRRFNDQMKGAMQIIAVLFGLLLVVIIAAAIWNASLAEGLVVESFSVPPQFVSAGIGGDVVADDLTEKIAGIVDFSNANSLALSKSVSENRAQQVKVEIPDTGVSLAEAWHYLRSWLGHERHLNGNIRMLPDGRITLTVSLGSADTFAFTGRPDELDALEAKAAERIFSVADPVNYVLYLNAKGRVPETLAAALYLTTLSQSDRDLGEAHALYSDMQRNLAGDMAVSIAHVKLALELDSAATPQHMEMLNSNRALGHDEEVLRQAREIAPLKLEDNVASWRFGEGFHYVKELGARYRALETGNFGEATTSPCLANCAPAEAALQHALAFANLHDTARAAQLIADAATYGGGDPVDVERANYFLDAAHGDWHAATRAAHAIDDALLADTSEAAKFEALRLRTQGAPLLAHALAESGDTAGAEAAIANTPLDCYACLRERGNAAAAKKDWAGAAQWFVRAVTAAPSVPFAYFDWGRMLLAKGDYDGAIEKFDQAHQKGPRFADPLEVWGEALILKSRSDLALAKFADAGRLAPKWAHLHLEWGKALWWSGDKDAARRQFGIASTLELPAVDKQALAQTNSWH